MNHLKWLLKRYPVSFIVFLFFLIFSPPIIPHVNTALLSVVYAFVMLMVHFRQQLKEGLRDSGIGRFSIGIGIFLLYVVVITVVNLLLGEKVQPTHYLKLYYRFFLLVPMLMIAALYICLQCRQWGFSLYDLAACFALATMIQFVLAIISLFFRPVKDFFTEWMYANTGDYYLSIGWVMARRGFGFTATFVDSFGFGMGLVAALPLFFLNKDRYHLVYLCPLLLMVSLLNVRTGLVIAGLGLVMALPTVIKTVRHMNARTQIKFLGVCAGAVALLILMVVLIFIFNPLTINWIVGDVFSVVEEVIPELAPVLPDIETGAETTTGGTLFSDRFWNFPKGWHLLFGTGHTIFGADGYAHSDVGYINDLWLGGILGCLLLYSTFGQLLVTAFRGSKLLHRRTMVIFFGLSFLVFQVKANAIMFNAGTAVMLPVLFYMCFLNSQQSKEGVRL